MNLKTTGISDWLVLCLGCENALLWLNNLPVLYNDLCNGHKYQHYKDKTWFCTRKLLQRAAQTTASVVAANRICLFLQAEHCPRGICNQHTKQNKSHRAMNQPVQEHLSPISTLSFYRLIIHLPPDSRILLLLSLIALMGNVQGCFCAFPARSFHSL